MNSSALLRILICCISVEYLALAQNVQTSESEHSYSEKDNEECCPSVGSWVNISEAFTLDGSSVEVMQNIYGSKNQYFWVERCARNIEGGPCKFLQKHKYTTRCMTQSNPVPAVTYNRETERVAWSMIMVPSKCTCIGHIQRQTQASLNDRVRRTTSTKANVQL